MKQTVDRIRESEERKGGLIIKKALYGKLEGESLTYVFILNVSFVAQYSAFDVQFIKGGKIINRSVDML